MIKLDNDVFLFDNVCRNSYLFNTWDRLVKLITLFTFYESMSITIVQDQGIAGFGAPVFASKCDQLSAHTKPVNSNLAFSISFYIKLTINSIILYVLSFR